MKVIWAFEAIVDKEIESFCDDISKAIEVNRTDVGGMIANE